LVLELSNPVKMDGTFEEKRSPDLRGS